MLKTTETSFLCRIWDEELRRSRRAQSRPVAPSHEELDEVVRRLWGRPRTAWKEYVCSWTGGTNEGRTPITMLTTCFDLGYNVIKVALLTKVGHCHMWCGLFKCTCAKKCSAPVGFMTAHLLPVPSVKLLISSWFCVNENGNEQIPQHCGSGHFLAPSSGKYTQIQIYHISSLDES